MLNSPVDKQSESNIAKTTAEREKRRKLRFEQRTTLSDCSLMLRYALDESCQIPQALAEDIAKADALLIAAGKDPLSDIAPELLKEEMHIAEIKDPVEDILLRIHSGLSNLVAPATALSLRETDPELHWLGMPRIVQLALIGACGFMLWFLIAVPKPELANKAGSETISSPTATPAVTQAH
jgi:hypothetical protein